MQNKKTQIVSGILASLKSNVFKTVRTNKNINCNILLIRMKNTYAIKDNDGIRIPSKLEINMLENILHITGHKLCSYTVNPGYIMENYKDSDISFVLFSNISVPYNLRKKNTPPISICGLLFLNNMKKHNALYIPLICAKSGLGGSLIELAEETAKKFKKKQVRLTSIDQPIGFYLKLGYQLQKGRNTYIVPKNVHVKLFKKKVTNEALEILNDSLVDSAAFTNKLGFVRKFKDVKFRLRTKKNNTASRKYSLRNRLNTSKFINKGDIGMLYNIKKDDDGIFMFKDL